MGSAYPTFLILDKKSVGTRILDFLVGIAHQEEAALLAIFVGDAHPTVLVMPALHV